MAVNQGSNRWREAPAPEQGELLGELNSADGQERVEVRLRSDENGRPTVELAQFHWGSGVGWYLQKTMILDGAQAHAFQALLAPIAASLTPPPTPSAAPRRRAPPRELPRVEQDGNVVRLLFS